MLVQISVFFEGWPVRLIVAALCAWKIEQEGDRGGSGGRSVPVVREPRQRGQNIFILKLGL